MACVLPSSGLMVSPARCLVAQLYSCILFKKSMDEFKSACREKRFTLRDFQYDPGAIEADRQKKEHDMVEYEKLKSMLSNWCHINYAVRTTRPHRTDAPVTHMLRSARRLVVRLVVRGRRCSGGAV